MRNEQYEPFLLFDEDSDEARLALDDPGMYAREAAFVRHGRESNGYGWASVARLVATTLPESVASRLDFNPEADMLSIYGPPGTLHEMAKALHALYGDAEALDSLIARSEVD